MNANECIKILIRYLGDDPEREGLRETPRRVLKSYQELFSGYEMKVENVFKVFQDGACDEMVVLRNIEFYSTCLAGSTFVETPRGRIPISRLEEGEFVYCWDEDEQQMTIGRAINPHITARHQRLWRIYTDKDTILCTFDHKFLTVEDGWVKAKRLHPGHTIVALNKGTKVVNGKPRAHIVWTGRTKQVNEARFIYKEINGTIKKFHQIHHIDEQPNNNSPENLTSLHKSKHATLHRLIDGPTGFALYSDKQRQAIEQKRLSKWKKSQTIEVNEKRRQSLIKYWSSMTPKEREQRNHRVLLVERTNWKEDVWCMDVPGYENFVANGMVVHNCEHHMLPFFGTAHIAYIPNGKVIGVSKLARILEVYARRLQIQERIATQVTDALDKFLTPKGSACTLEAKHLCMCCRGVNKQNAVMVTSSLSGAFRKDPATRAEFLSLIGKG